MIVDEVVVRQLRLPLEVPYRVSSGALTMFDPFVVEIRGDDGAEGWGEALIVPGYTPETVQQTWDNCCAIGHAMLGRPVDAACASAEALAADNPGAASALLGALAMLTRDPILVTGASRRIPLLAPLQGHERAELRDEIDALLAQGYRTLKVKVGYDWQADLDRVACIQELVGERATLRLDANRGYDVTDGTRFAQRLQPAGIELFEQPCGADDWDANAAVAAVSTVPVMLDESIYGVDDIDRAATVRGVGFVKLKLKKIGGLGALAHALRRIRALGMVPVLGDGVSMDIACWMEACVAATEIDNAGEMNGFLKARQQLFANPLRVEQGAIVLDAGYWPRVDRGVIEATTERLQRCARRVRA